MKWKITSDGSYFLGVLAKQYNIVDLHKLKPSTNTSTENIFGIISYRTVANAMRKCVEVVAKPKDRENKTTDDRHKIVAQRTDLQIHIP